MERNDDVSEGVGETVETTTTTVPAMDGFRTFLPTRPLPEHFSFVSDDPWNGEVAGSKIPASAEQLEALHADAGVTLIVSLTEERCLPTPVDKRFRTKRPFRVLSLPYPDGGVPPDALTLRAMHEMGKEVAAGGRVLVHCLAGVGRTGTVLAIWTAWRRNLPADAAIALLRTFRPNSMAWHGCSNRFRHQEDYVRSFLERHPRPKAFPGPFLDHRGRFWVSPRRDESFKASASEPMDAFALLNNSQIAAFSVRSIASPEERPYSFDSEIVAGWKGGFYPEIDRRDTATALLSRNRRWLHLIRPSGWGKTRLLSAIREVARERHPTAKIFLLDFRDAPCRTSRELDDWLGEWAIRSLTVLGVAPGLSPIPQFWDSLEKLRARSDGEPRAFVFLDHLDWPHFCPDVLERSTERDADELLYRRARSCKLDLVVQSFFRWGSVFPKGRSSDDRKGDDAVRFFSAARFPVAWDRSPRIESCVPPLCNPDVPVGFTPRELTPFLRACLKESADVERALSELDQTYGREALDVVSLRDVSSRARLSNLLASDDTFSALDGSFSLIERHEDESVVDWRERVLELEKLNTWQISPRDLGRFLNRRSPFCGPTYDESDPIDSATTSLVHRLGFERFWETNPLDFSRWSFHRERLQVSSQSDAGARIPAYFDGTVPTESLGPAATAALLRGLGDCDAAGYFRYSCWENSPFVGTFDRLLLRRLDPRDVRVEREHRRAYFDSNGLDALRRLGSNWIFKVPSSSPGSERCDRKPRLLSPAVDALSQEPNKVASAIADALVSEHQPTVVLAAAMLFRVLDSLKPHKLQRVFLFWLEHAWIRPARGSFDRRATRWPDLGPGWQIFSLKRTLDDGSSCYAAVSFGKTGNPLFALEFSGLEDATTSVDLSSPCGREDLPPNLTVVHASTCGRYVAVGTVQSRFRP